MVHDTTYAGSVKPFGISWRSVFAGLVAGVAVSILMAVLGAALQFSMFDPTGAEPFAGMGTAFGIWSLVSVMASLAVGGFVAGFFGRVRGYEHGFMVWASMLIVATLFGGMAIGTAVRAVGGVVSGIASGAATVASGVGEGAGTLAAAAVTGLGDDVNLDFSEESLGNSTIAVLRDTGISTLQPGYLAGQMRAARSDLRGALNQIRLEPGSYEQPISTFLSRQEERLSSLGQNVDREAAISGLMQSRGISRVEAAPLVDDALLTYNRVLDQAEGALTDAGQQLEQTLATLTQAAERARVQADEFATAAARSSLLAAVALLLGAVLTTVMGMVGVRTAHSYYATRNSAAYGTFRGAEI